MGKTLPVVWAEEAVRDAVRRVARALQTVDKDALLLGKLGVTTQDLWCLVDAGRATLEQTEAVSSAVASAHLSGVDLPADWVDTLGKVASGEVTADDAVQAVVDGELRRRIASRIVQAWVGREPLPIVAYADALARQAMEVVAPALRKAYLDGHDSGYAAANVPDPWAKNPVVDVVAPLLAATDAQAEDLAADALQLDVEMAQLRRDLETAVAIREQATEERDAALRKLALADAGDVVGAQRADIDRLRDERDEAREYVERLVLAARGDWPSWGDDVPAAFMEAERHIDGLRARPTVHAYEAACEALEKRRVALANAIQYETASFYDAVDEVQAMRAELDAAKSKAKADAGWNEAIDWLLNSRHTADPDIQSAFWGMVEGRFTRKQAEAGVFEYDDEGNAHIPTDDEQPDTEATEQDPLVPIGPELAAKMLGAVTEQAPREPRVWREGDRVVCPPDTEQHYPGTVTGFNDYGRPLVKWDHWHKVDAYAPDQLAEVIEDGAQ